MTQDMSNAELAEKVLNVARSVDEPDMQWHKSAVFLREAARRLSSIPESLTAPNDKLRKTMLLQSALIDAPDGNQVDTGRSGSTPEHRAATAPSADERVILAAQILLANAEPVASVGVKAAPEVSIDKQTTVINIGSLLELNSACLSLRHALDGHRKRPAQQAEGVAEALEEVAKWCDEQDRIAQHNTRATADIPFTYKKVAAHIRRLAALPKGPSDG